MESKSNNFIAYVIKSLINFPLVYLLLVFTCLGFAISQLQYLEVDASADSLLLENDPDLAFYREINKRYANEDFLLISYTPHAGVFNEQALQELKIIRDELKKLHRVSNTLSILDVPLVSSPRLAITELTKGLRTIEGNNVDLKLAELELVESPFYQDLLLSRDKTTTAIQVLFERDDKYFSLLTKRNELLALNESNPQDTTNSELKKAIAELNEYKKVIAQYESETIQQVRNIIKKHSDSGSFSVGGASMITSDIVSFINDDLRIFGTSIILFIIFSLLITFRHYLWVTIPLVCCLVNVILVSGALSFLDWKISIISSNYVSLILILTMSICIHLIVRYRELSRNFPELSSKQLVEDTLLSLAKPCFYTTLTTVIAFLSLTLSGIQPVITFGWIMTIGVSLSFVLSFVLFAAILNYLPAPKTQFDNNFIGGLTYAIGRFSINNDKLVFVIFSALSLLSIVGITQLSVENRFIDYFKKDTEIYKGMLEIDTKLGGTTSFDIILNAPQNIINEKLNENESSYDPEFDDFDLFDDEEEDPIANSYWYTPSGLKKIEAIHDYINSLPETGKVLSLATIYKIAIDLNNGKEFNQLELLFLYNALPPELKKQLMGAYLSEDGMQVRIATRIVDSTENMNRNLFIHNLEKNLLKDFSLEKEQLQFSGLMVLYNNLLQALFSSQIKSLGFVFFAIFLVFLFIFRSFQASVVAIIPNLASAILILGFIGLIKLPLDFMTITVASITIGIAVDDTIHYMHRFKNELHNTKNYQQAIHNSHRSVGKAMYHTSLIIVAGFSILVLSNFNPSMYFGLLTGLAMFIALVCDLVLLPATLKILKPYKI